MGDIPDRRLFRHVVLEKALLGYFEIVKGTLSPYHSLTHHKHLSVLQPFELVRFLNSKPLSPSTPSNLRQTEPIP